MPDFIDYPKIPDPRGCPGGPCVAFEKLDGTNLGWEWSRGAGFLRATTRRRELDGSDPVLGGAIELFLARLAIPLDALFERHPAFAAASAVKVFTELHGRLSFAGVHVADDPKTLTVIDVWTDHAGLLGPRELLEALAGLPLPRVLYKGPFTGQLTTDVREGRYGPIEGAVVKGGATGAVWMCKVKTKAWTTKLEESFRTGEWVAADGIRRTLDEEADR